MVERDPIIVGVRGVVLALDPATGTELWRRTLRSGHFANVATHGKLVIATTRGEVFALDRTTGHVLWNNPLRGLGWGFVTIAGAGQVPPMRQSQQDSDGAAAAAVAASS